MQALPRIRQRSRTLAPLIAALAAVSCGEEPLEPAPAPVAASITVTAPDSTLLAGSAIQLSAEVRDETGRTLNVSVDWSSSDTTVANVNSRGVVTALTPGTARIRAAYNEISSSIELRVEHHPDRAALAEFYHALDGPGWSTPDGPGSPTCRSTSGTASRPTSTATSPPCPSRRRAQGPSRPPSPGSTSSGNSICQAMRSAARFRPSSRPSPASRPSTWRETVWTVRSRPKSPASPASRSSTWPGPA